MREQVVILLDDSEQVVKEITYGQWVATREAVGDFDNDVALVVACTGLPAVDVDQMNTPDFNELLNVAESLNNATTTNKAGASQVPLSYAALTVMGDTVTTAVITMPKVIHSRELAKLTDPYHRMEYMIKTTTGFIDLISMPMSDYSLLVDAVPDFFGQGVGFFRKAK